MCRWQAGKNPTLGRGKVGRHEFPIEGKEMPAGGEGMAGWEGRREGRAGCPCQAGRQAEGMARSLGAWA